MPLAASASRRDSYLGAAAASLAAGFVLYVVARALELTDSFVRPYPGELQVTAGFLVLSAAAAVAAFVLAARAFLHARKKRPARLGAAMALLAVSFLAGAAGFATEAIFFSTRRFTLRGAEEAFAMQAGAAFLLAVAFLVAAAAFLRTGAPAALAQRDRLLGWACVGLAIGVVALTSGTVLLARMYSDLATSPYVAGIGTVAAGDAIAVLAALVAAGAFFTSNPGGKRDMRLGVGSAIAFGAFLVGAAGYLLVAWVAPSNSVDSTLLLADWFSGFGTLVFALAFLCAAAGLWPPAPRR
jgi:hypothetical protein